MISFPFPLSLISPLTKEEWDALDLVPLGNVGKHTWGERLRNNRRPGNEKVMHWFILWSVHMTRLRLVREGLKDRNLAMFGQRLFVAVISQIHPEQRETTVDFQSLFPGGKRTLDAMSLPTGSEYRSGWEKEDEKENRSSDEMKWAVMIPSSWPVQIWLKMIVLSRPRWCPL